jgi:predicted nuclease of predicted toxin-antitoxin system
MKFIVDAQLPRRLAHPLAVSGQDATHTLELTKGNRTPDSELRAIAIQENRVVVSKDEDFVTHYLLHGAPPKLLLISTGNISNNGLLTLVAKNLTALVAALCEHDFVELTMSAITIHD